MAGSPGQFCFGLPANWILCEWFSLIALRQLDSKNTPHTIFSECFWLYQDISFFQHLFRRLFLRFKL